MKQLKKCRKCQVIKSTFDFYNCVGGRFGVRGTCKLCVTTSWNRNAESINAKKRERYAADPEIRAMRKKAYASWRDQAKANGTYDPFKLRGHLTQYSVTVEWYYERLEAQRGVCAICKKPPTEGRYGRLTVDHDHNCCPPNNSCGKCIRGLICQHCNRVLGHAKDRPEILLQAAAYLTSFAPATTERENPETGCDSLNSYESMREKSEAVSPLAS